MNADKLQKILDNTVDNKQVFGTQFYIQFGEDNWLGASGNISLHEKYFIASTTKLFITAVFLKHIHLGNFHFEDTLNLYFSKEQLNELHVINGIDYTSKITMKHLLAHTSGLPDYFQQKKDGVSIENELLKGEDRYWDFDEILKYNKSLIPKFPPGYAGKAFYSDTNFQILGKIIEIKFDLPIKDILSKEIINDLGLKNTYMYHDINDDSVKPLYYKQMQLHIPKAMTSFGADGGIVSNSEDMFNFLHSFFNSRWFPKENIETLKTWNRIFFPMKSGVGIHLFKLPWIMNPFGTIPELYGHSGLSGALAFANPEKELYITGTVNQISNPSLSFKTMIKLINALK